ncbi:energy-coupling factor ABC transporter ATP-binding protein [Tepidibacter mesophilus]|uniref:energy-coupling factor ABC transporter ATP-binding protein n=1 Tax=Tepidibacter mesophilus TaxID=655607 RepID=UPI000C06C82E|nr:ATP-binding cassette domain-containing protein [Tepidibacter mesophilus]
MLKMENITYIYEDKTVALEDINIDFKNGNKIGIIGSNGAGKSTLFLNCTGIYKPNKGNISFNEQPIKYDKKYLYKLREKVGIVFQDPDRQIFYSNVYDDVAFGLRNLGIDENIVKKRVDKALESVGAIEFKDKPVHFLSYGQKKRVAMAGVLAMESEIIFFDEPTAGLDPIVTESVVNILEEIHNNGKKIIISSHDMDLIYRLCDYIYVLNKGKVIEEGIVEDVFLKEDVLKMAGLVEPWLVKIHKNMGLPLFKDEKELYKYWEKHRE